LSTGHLGKLLSRPLASNHNFLSILGPATTDSHYGSTSWPWPWPAHRTSDLLLWRRGVCL